MMYNQNYSIDEICQMTSDSGVFCEKSATCICAHCGACVCSKCSVPFSPPSRICSLCYRLEHPNKRPVHESADGLREIRKQRISLLKRINLNLRFIDPQGRSRS